MCGRVGFFDDVQWQQALRESKLWYENRVASFRPSYNIAPSQQLPALLSDHRYINTSFGLIPHWAKTAENRPINARSESIDEKPMFRDSFQHKRALIPINGFYEWRKEGKLKQPYWFHPTEQDYFALGGIWDEWYDNELGRSVISSAIITTRPNATMAPIHDRMPVIIPKESWALWLDSEVQEKELLQELFAPCESDKISAYRVSTRVNSPVNDDAALLLPKQAVTLF